MIGGITRGNRGMGRKRAAAALVMAAVCALLAGCSSSMAGTPRMAPYQPIPAAQMTATMANPVDGAVAYSHDGRTVAILRNSTLCVRQVSAPDVDAACPTLPDGTVVGEALLDPSGQTLAVLEDYQSTYRGRLWLVDTDDGSVRQVPFPDAECGQPAPHGSASGNGSAPGSTPGSASGSTSTAISPTTTLTATSPTTTSAAGSSESDSPPGLYLSVTWLADGRLAAAAHPMSGPDGAGDCLVLVDPSAGQRVEAVPVRDAVPAGVYVWSVPESGGSTVAFLQQAPGGESISVGAVDVDDGSHRTIDLDGVASGSPDPRLPLMAVSPDGSSAIVGGLDPVTLHASPISVLDLRDGSATTLTTVHDGYAVDATFSPDGSQVLLAVQGTRDEPSRLTVIPSGGGQPRTITELDGDLPVMLDLAWTRTNLIVPTSPRAPASLDDIAPWQLSG